MNAATRGRKRSSPWDVNKPCISDRCAERTKHRRQLVRPKDRSRRPQGIDTKQCTACMCTRPPPPTTASTSPAKNAPATSKPSSIVQRFTWNHNGPRRHENSPISADLEPHSRQTAAPATPHLPKSALHARRLDGQVRNRHQTLPQIRTQSRKPISIARKLDRLPHIRVLAPSHPLIQSERAHDHPAPDDLQATCRQASAPAIPSITHALTSSARRMEKGPAECLHPECRARYASIDTRISTFSLPSGIPDIANRSTRLRATSGFGTPPSSSRAPGTPSRMRHQVRTTASPSLSDRLRFANVTPPRFSAGSTPTSGRYVGCLKPGAQCTWTNRSLNCCCNVRSGSAAAKMGR